MVIVDVVFIITIMQVLALIVATNDNNVTHLENPHYILLPVPV